MGMENLLGMPGVQMVLKQLIGAAAPELSAQVEQVSETIVAFKAQLDRVEAQQREILAILKGDHAEILGDTQHGDVGRTIGGTRNPA